MTESPDNLLTIGEIAARARHLASDPYAFVERARHWAKIGLLCAVDTRSFPRARLIWPPW